MSMFSAQSLNLIHITPCKMNRKSGCVLWSIYYFYLRPILLWFIRFIGRSVTKDIKHRVTCLCIFIIDLHVAVSSLFSYILIYSFLYVSDLDQNYSNSRGQHKKCRVLLQYRLSVQHSHPNVVKSRSSKTSISVVKSFQELFRARQWHYTAVQNIYFFYNRAIGYGHTRSREIWFYGV